MTSDTKVRTSLELWSSGIRHAHHSGEVVAELLEIIGHNLRTLDLTFGHGTFWKNAQPVELLTNDAYQERADAAIDFRITPWANQSFGLVVFDPPFTSAGKPSDGSPGFQRYGASREALGAPQNIEEVQGLLTGGIAEACRLSNRYVLVKTQDVVEGGKLHASVVLALNTLVTHGFMIRAERPFKPARRPQPPGRRVTGLGGRPSVFILAERDHSIPGQ